MVSSADQRYSRDGRATTTMKKATTPSQLIDARIKELSDWRGETLARVRILIKQADPEVVESGSGEGFRCGRTPE
jgi:hypothetical protein